MGHYESEMAVESLSEEEQIESYKRRLKEKDAELIEFKRNVIVANYPPTKGSLVWISLRGAKEDFDKKQFEELKKFSIAEGTLVKYGISLAVRRRSGISLMFHPETEEDIESTTDLYFLINECREKEYIFRKGNKNLSVASCYFQPVIMGNIMKPAK